VISAEFFSKGINMKQAAALFIAAIAFTANAHAAVKSCDELKSEIAAKLEAKGVKDYTLAVVASEIAGDKKVVGSCDGGIRKIVYTRK
jgi:hypothetical protein